MNKCPKCGYDPDNNISMYDNSPSPVGSILGGAFVLLATISAIILYWEKYGYVNWEAVFLSPLFIVILVILLLGILFVGIYWLSKMKRTE